VTHTRSHSIRVAATMLGVLGGSAVARGQDRQVTRSVPVRRAAVAVRERVVPAKASSRDSAPTPGTATASVAASISTALADFRATGVARSVIVGTVSVLPFGRVDPVVTCSVLRACIVELEAGERLVDAPVTGDPVRWSIDSAKAGPGGATPLVLVKPRACDVTTNLVVPTDRRVYDLTLDSPPCTRGSLNPRQSGVRHVRFYYPDDVTTAADVSSVRIASPDSARDADPLTTMLAQSGHAGSLVNREYRLVRHRRGPLGLFGRKPVDFPWQPAGVADDGARTYVALPRDAAPHAAPVFYAVERDGSRTMVNYAVRLVSGQQVYVADRVVRRAVLVLMNGSREQRLELENRAWGRSAASRQAADGQKRGAQVGG